MQWFDYVVSLFQQAHYLGLFGVLIACGLGVPIPEEVTFIAAGYLIHSGYTQFLPTVLVGFLGILGGDMIVYGLGRYWGPSLYSRWPFSRILSPKALVKVQDHFDRHGHKTIFIARFLMGLRAPTFFVAGSMRMKPWLFLLMDGLGALISMPVSVWLGWRFGGEIDTAWALLREFDKYILIALACLVAFFVIRHYVSPPAAKAPAPAPPAATDAAAPPGDLRSDRTEAAPK